MRQADEKMARDAAQAAQWEEEGRFDIASVGFEEAADLAELILASQPNRPNATQLRESIARWREARARCDAADKAKKTPVWGSSPAHRCKGTRQLRVGVVPPGAKKPARGQRAACPGCRDCRP